MRCQLSSKISKASRKPQVRLKLQYLRQIYLNYPQSNHERCLVLAVAVPPRRGLPALPLGLLPQLLNHEQLGQHNNSGRCRRLLQAKLRRTQPLHSKVQDCLGRWPVQLRKSPLTTPHPEILLTGDFPVIQRCSSWVFDRPRHRRLVWWRFLSSARGTSSTRPIPAAGTERLFAAYGQRSLQCAGRLWKYYPAAATAGRSMCGECQELHAVHGRESGQHDDLRVVFGSVEGLSGGC
jgi:hypothetical protein